MQIKSLESDVGATLLERRYHRVELTPAGAALLPYARSVLDKIAQARESLDAVSNTLSGRLRIVASTTPGDYVIPKVLGSFLREYPQVRIEIRVTDTAQALELVECGDADLGVCGARPDSTKVAFDEIGCDDILLICPVGHPFASRAVTPGDLAEADWVMREAGSGTGRVVRSFLAGLGVEPDELRVLVELGTGDSLVSAVEGGLGVAFVSQLAAAKALELGTVAQATFAEGPIRRPFYSLLPATNPSRAAVALLDHLRRVIACDLSRPLL
jgi:DNA-binding transcriptional LysR family regulator